MLNPIKQIYQFNQQAGLLDGGYSDRRECAYPIEEMLEGFDNTAISTLLGITADSSPKGISRAIMANVDTKENTLSPLSDVERLDKHIDAIVFNFGSIFKLGLTTQEAMKALGTVMNVNMTKLSVGTDSEGKQLKPKDFVGPEAELQNIIDIVHARSKS